MSPKIQASCLMYRDLMCIAIPQTWHVWQRIMVDASHHVAVIDGMDMSLRGVTPPCERLRTGHSMRFCAEGWTAHRRRLYKHPISTARRYTGVVEAKLSRYGTGARKHR